jgi:hypothetical protein
MSTERFQEIKQLYLQVVNNYFDMNEAYMHIENKDMQTYLKLNNHFQHDFGALTHELIDLVNDNWSEDKMYGDPDFDKDSS